MNVQQSKALVVPEGSTPKAGTSKSVIDALRDAQLEVPTNELGLPTGYYRPDIFHTVYAAQQFDQSNLGPNKSYHGDAAFVQLNYLDGYPMLPDGRPFWEQHGCEPHDAFKSFQEYLSQPYRGTDFGSKGGARQLHHVAAIFGLPADVLQDFVVLYSWTQRAKAYDLFREASQRRTRELLASQLQSSHFDVSSSMMRRLLAYMDDEDEFWGLMTPKTAIDLFKNLVTVQRVSVGLPGMAPAQPSSADTHAHTSSFEMIVRQVATANKHIEDASQVQLSNTLERVNANPDVAMLAQELILKMTNPNTPSVQDLSSRQEPSKPNKSYHEPNKSYHGDETIEGEFREEVDLGGRDDRYHTS